MHSESTRLKHNDIPDTASEQEKADFVIWKTYRNRLPSLYSDFTLQKTTNPDGYAVNVAAWEQALIRAAKQGYISRDAGTSSANNAAAGRVKSNHLVLKANESLLRDLEIPELGQPVALSTVFVRLTTLLGSNFDAWSMELL